jgi:hypothetical protein
MSPNPPHTNVTTPPGTDDTLGDKIAEHASEAQAHLTRLMRHVVQLLKGDATDEEKRDVEHLMVHLSANLSHLEELGRDVLELEEYITDGPVGAERIDLEEERARRQR